jgi:hypothetical protein
MSNKVMSIDTETTVINYGKWEIDNENNISIDCYVTDDERRLLSLRGTARAMGLTGGGSGALVRNMKSNYLQPYLSEDLKKWISDVENNEIKLIKGSGKSFTPFDATLFVDLCKAYVTAKSDGIFEDPQWEKQSVMADKLLSIMSAFAKVGIIALIDEITGYQEERQRDELQKLLAEFVRKEYLPWARRFQEEFYIEMYRLKDWDYRGNSKTPYVGKLTNYLVYDLLPEGVLEELQRKNPVDKKLKRRKNRHHQYLTESTGITYLDKHLVSVITLMRACDTWEEFDKLFRKSFAIVDKIS